MEPSKPSLVRFILIMLLIILLPVLTGVADLSVDNDLFDGDDDFSALSSFLVSWPRISIQQLTAGLMLGMSIFALFVVYLGGRSNHKRFNDRTIDAINALRGIFSATALNRAVFVFLLSDPHPGHTNKRLI